MVRHRCSCVVCGVNVHIAGRLTAEPTLEGNRARKRLVIKVIVKL